MLVPLLYHSLFFSAATFINVSYLQTHIVSLHFIGFCRYCIFYKLMVGGSPVLNKSVSTIFPTAFHVSLHASVTFLVISEIFQTSITFVMVICDL